MSRQKNQDNLFTPSSLYSLHGAAFGVWVMCIVIGSLFTNLTSYEFRAVAFAFSLLIAIAIWLKDNNWKQFQYFVMVIFNAGLIFINATGFNTISQSAFYNNMNNDSTFKKITTAGVFDVTHQKNWFPDKELLYKVDSLGFEYLKTERKNQALINQFAYLKDYIQGKVKDTTTLQDINYFLKYFGKYELNKDDIVDLLDGHEAKVRSLNAKIDSLRITLYVCQTSTSSYTIDGVNMSGEKWIDSLYNAVQIAKSELEYCRAKQRSSRRDSL